MMEFRVRLQLAEAFGPVNRWYCSEAHGRKVDDKELLLTYYIKSGGVENFAKNYDEALGGPNRWYCSEFYRREISDHHILWEYYMNHASARTVGKNPQCEPNNILAELNIAC